MDTCSNRPVADEHYLEEEKTYFKENSNVVGKFGYFELGIYFCN